MAQPSDKKKKNLQNAANQWKKVALEPDNTDFFKETCLRAAEMLELQIKDGIARCVCCQKPLSITDHRKQAATSRSQG